MVDFFLNVTILMPNMALRPLLRTILKGLLDPREVNTRTIEGLLDCWEMDIRTTERLRDQMEFDSKTLGVS